MYSALSILMEVGLYKINILLYLYIIIVDTRWIYTWHLVDSNNKIEMRLHLLPSVFHNHYNYKVKYLGCNPNFPKYLYGSFKWLRLLTDCCQWQHSHAGGWWLPLCPSGCYWVCCVRVSSLRSESAFVQEPQYLLREFLRFTRRIGSLKKSVLLVFCWLTPPGVRLTIIEQASHAEIKWRVKW